jgi:hypothetical protein
MGTIDRGRPNTPPRGHGARAVQRRVSNELESSGLLGVTAIDFSAAAGKREQYRRADAAETGP